MESQTKTPRSRVANFTADEKALLAKLVKKRPIVESKITNGKSVAKKKAAWELITQEFNCNANVHKRETITLKRAWDNMKAVTRKARATERGNLIRTVGGPHAPPPTQHGAIISMVEEAAPVVITKISNSFDSDGAILLTIDSNQNLGLNDEPIITESNNNLDILEEYKMDSTTQVMETHQINSPQIEHERNSIDLSDKNNDAVNKTTSEVRRPMEYIRREAVMRLRNLENKKKIEIQILKTQLEAEQIKKRAALMQEETNKCLFEKAKRAALFEEEINKCLLEKAKIELEELKKLVAKKVVTD